MNKGATFSADRKYRYRLWRIWDDRKPMLLNISLNPSDADENRDDPTTTRMMWRAGAGGFGGVYMANLYALVDPIPSRMIHNPDPVGPDNDRHLRAMIGKAGKVICSWGSLVNTVLRAAEVLKMIPEPYCLGFTKTTGQPRHPLYVAYSTPFIRWVRI